jgi:hypothetical protein
MILSGFSEAPPTEMSFKSFQLDGTPALNLGESLASAVE